MGKVKVVLYTVIAFILSLDSFFVISGSTTDSKKIYVGSLLHSASQPFIYLFIFFDSLSSDKKACVRRSASKTKCTINGAIVRADRKKSEAWVDSGKERSSPDPTRPKSPLFYYSTADIVPCTISLRFCFFFCFLLNERLEKTSNNKSS